MTSLNFKLTTQRTSQPQPMNTYFDSRIEMIDAIHYLIKNHFIGEMHPFSKVQGTWKPDKESIEAMETPSILERNMLFSHASGFLRILSKSKSELTQTEKEDLIEIMSSIAGIIGEVTQETPLHYRDVGEYQQTQ
jgi:hypothetical protein